MSPLVLLIEDCEDLQELYSDVLKNHFLLSVVGTGERGLFFLENGLPDLVLMDLTLGDMETHQFLAKFKLIPGVRSVPLIVMSGREDIAFWAKEFGAVHYFKKPINPKLITNYIQELFPLYESVERNL